MTDQSTRPEVEDPRVLALAKARQQIAFQSVFNAVCPPWDGLTGQEQQTSLLEARNWLHAAMSAGLVADRAAVLRDAAVALDADMERFFGEWPDEPRNSPYALGRKDAATELRRLAAEAQLSEAEAAATHVRDCLDRPAVIRWCADRVRSTDGDYVVQAAAEYLDDLATEAEETA